MADPDAYIDLNEEELRATARAQGGQLVIKTTVKILNRAKILCPVDTGRLRSSLQMKITQLSGEVRGAVFTNVNYAKYVHGGTRPHKIYPKTKKVLRFASPARSSNIIFAASVNHPGTRAQPFLARAIAEVAPAAGFAPRPG